MAHGTLMAVDEYLHTAYDPDCDYVDGEIEERNVGERDHALLQGELYFYFRARQTEWRGFVIPEQRLRVSPTRFRVPDICVYAGKIPNEQVFTTPPFICIEILSPEDRMSRVQDRVDDYLAFGVRYIWVIDPRTRRAWVYDRSGCVQPADGVLRTENPAFEVPLRDLFGGIDEMVG